MGTYNYVFVEESGSMYEMLYPIMQVSIIATIVYILLLIPVNLIAVGIIYFRCGYETAQEWWAQICAIFIAFVWLLSLLVPKARFENDILFSIMLLAYIGLPFVVIVAGKLLRRAMKDSKWRKWKMIIYANNIFVTLGALLACMGLIGFYKGYIVI